MTAFYRITAALALCVSAGRAGDKTLESDEQARLLDEVRQYALSYSANLPDFICTEETRRYVDDNGHGSWRLGDTIAARLSYFHQKEDYEIVSLNGHPAKNVPYSDLGGAFSVGDFGTAMRYIFDPASHATFEWKKLTTLRGRRTYAFTYRIPQGTSQYILAFQTSKDNSLKVKVAYRGAIFMDKDLHTIVRIEQDALNIPPSFPILSAVETLDYDFTHIGSGEYFLPSEVNLEMHCRDHPSTRNVKEFRQFKKFAADSEIRFESQP